MLNSRTAAQCREAAEPWVQLGQSAVITKPNHPSILPICPMSHESTSLKNQVMYSQLPVSFHDGRREKSGQHWGHMPAEQMLPCPAQSSHGPAAEGPPLVLSPDKSFFQIQLPNCSNCVDCSVYDLARLRVTNRQFVRLPSVGCHCAWDCKIYMQ